MTSKPRIFLPAALIASTILPAALGQAGQPLAKEAVLTSLSTKLDSKKTKVGDAVAAKTLNPLTLNDGSVVPSGSRILGKVTQVQSKSSGTATIAIEFDQLEKKGAAATPVHGLIAGIAPLPDLGSGGGAAANDIPGRGNAAQNAAMTGMSTGAGSSTESQIPAGSSIKGVILNSTPAADGSVAIQSTEKDFKLENGTRLEIGLTAAQ